MLFMIQMQILHSFYQFFPPPPSWQLMLFMIQKQILHSFYQFFPPLLATNAFHDSNANITFLLSILPPPLLATNAFHDSKGGGKTHITILLSKFFPPPPLLATNAFHDSKVILHSFYQFFLSPPSWQLMLFMIQK